jgi:integrase
MGRGIRLPKHVHGWVDNRRGGAVPRYYLRRPGFKQTPLPGIPWSPEFMEAYTAAMSPAPAQTDIGASRTRPGTVNAVIISYIHSEDSPFKDFAPATQSTRRAALERFRSEHGDKRLALMGAQHVERILSRLKPFPQRNMLKALRGLMAYAIVQKIIGTDPTAGYKPTRVKDTGGFKMWIEADIGAYTARHPIGTRAHLALALLLGTGGRRGDVVKLGRKHVTDGVLSFRASKTGAAVDIPVLPELQRALDATPSNNWTFLVTEQGKPFTANGFGNWFRDRCREAGLNGLSAHGLRKAAATRFAENGATAHELMAWFGWSKITEAERYTRAANRKALAAGMVLKLESRTGGGNRT